VAGWLEIDGFRVRVFFVFLSFSTPKLPPKIRFFSSLFYREKNNFFQMLSKHLYLIFFSENEQYQHRLDEENQ
jgi:hypothetical protein